MSQTAYSSPEPAHELELMQAVANSDRGAIEALYDRFGSLVYRLAFQAMPTRRECEDAVQAIFVRLWQTAGRYDPERAALVTWVMLISRRHLVDELRRTQLRARTIRAARTAALNLDPFYADASRQAEYYERIGLARNMIEALVPSQREVVILRIVKQVTIQDAAMVLGIAEGTVESRLTRARASLRRMGALAS